MNFRTELHPTPAAYKLSQTAKVVTVGSCFSDVIGSQLEKYKVETLTNPFGTIFNPLSACKLLQVCAGADVELADSFVKSNGRWYSYDFHSSFSAETEEELYEILDEAIVKTRRFLKKADALIFTLGTANIFRLNITGETVANCHKLPATDFTRETLLPEEIITGIAETHSLLRELNPNLKLVLTVSPVRHLKDTLELNSVSKAVLRLATHFLSQNLPEITYFPAYELLLDDLRDYRFYKEDLLHPTQLAETYIWQKFTGAYFENTFQLFTEEWDKILRAKEHKPFHPESPQHQAFIQQTLERLRILQEKIDITEELAYFESQVILLPEVVEEPDSEEEEVTEKETIPGYFREETEVEVGEELADAALTETGVATLPEEGLVRKKKKKPRKKKKKRAGTAEPASLTEVGTAASTEVAVIETPSEPAAELAEILATPVHAITHYGETLSESSAEQVRPITPAKSKSAKRRESRKKKKALAITVNIPVSETSEDITSAHDTTEALTSTPTFTTENATVLSEKTPEVQANTQQETSPEIAVERPVKKRGGRNKKNTFPDLFSSETSETASEESGKTIIEPKAVPANSEAANENSVSEIAASIVPKNKPKGKGRQSKTAKLFTADATPVTETIAVPFVNASDLEEAVTPKAVAKPKTKAKTLKLPAVSKPAKTPKNEVKKASEGNEIIETPEKVKAILAKRKSPVKKPVSAEVKAIKAPAKTTAKPTRKKKTAPEA